MPRDTSGNKRPKTLAQPWHGIPLGARPKGPLGSALSGDAGLQGRPPTRAQPGPTLCRQPRPGAEFYYPSFTILTGKQI